MIFAASDPTGGAGLQRTAHRGRFVVHAEDQQGQRRMLPVQLFDQLHAAGTGHREIRNQQIGFHGTGPVAGIPPGGNGAGDGAPAGGGGAGAAWAG